VIAVVSAISCLRRRTPGAFTAFTDCGLRALKPALAVGIGGAWLIAAVTTQTIAVLLGTLGAVTAPWDEVQFICLEMFMIGCMLQLPAIRPQRVPPTS